MNCPVCGVHNVADAAKCGQCASDLIVHRCLDRLEILRAETHLKEINMNTPAIGENNDNNVSSNISSQTGTPLQPNRRSWAVAVAISQVISICAIITAFVALFIISKQLNRLVADYARLAATVEKIAADSRGNASIVSENAVANDPVQHAEVLSSLVHTLALTTEMLQQEHIDRRKMNGNDKETSKNGSSSANTNLRVSDAAFTEKKPR